MAECGLAVVLGLGVTIAACEPCSPDEYEPNDAEGEASAVGDITTDLNEIDANFDDQQDADCFSYAIPEPISEDLPILYIEFKGADREELGATLSFACDEGDPAMFFCNGEELTDTTCSVNGKEPRFRVTYDCDDTSDKVGKASLRVCVTRPDPAKLCTDYSIRAYFN